MRTLSGGERSVIQPGAGFWCFAYLRVQNFDGTWINLGALAVGSRTLNFFNSLTWSDNVDANTVSMQATMKREIGAFSLSPFRSDSPINVDDAGTTYEPLLDLHRRWDLWGVCLPRGTYPDPADYRELASGWVDRIDIQGDPATITVQGRGMEADLIDRRILFVDASADPLVPISETTPKTYAAGTQADVIQAILDEELGAGVVTLTVDGSAPAEYVNGWDQTTEVGLFDLLTQIASLGGGSLRYKYDATDVLSLTLYSVNRNPSNADWQTDADEYEKLDVGIGNEKIRNFVSVRYVDTNFGIQAVTSPVAPPYPPTSASIARYELRPLSIDLSADTRVNDQTAAGNLADAVRADMEFPLIEQRLAGTGLWFGELGDYVKVLANTVHYNEDQYGGVTTLSHTFANGELVSTFEMSGKPKGRYLTWLDFGGGPPRVPFTPTLTSLDATHKEFRAPFVTLAWVNWTTVPGTYTHSVRAEYATTADFASVIATHQLDVTPGTAFGWVLSIPTADRGVLYYVRVTPYSGPLVAGVVSGVAGEQYIANTHSLLKPTDSPTVSINYDTAGEIRYDVIAAPGTPLGDVALTLGSIGIPTVFVNVTEDDEWLALSTIPTAEVEVGGEFRRQRYLVGAGSVRLNANIKTLTGTPTVKLKYTVNAFGAVADVMTWAPGGTGLQSSGFVAVPTGARADAGLTIYVADGADTAVLDLYELDAEFLPATVSGVRVHTDAFAAAFN